MTYKANDDYKAVLRQTWIAPDTTTIQVTAIPTNLPTIVTANHKQSTQTKFSVTGVSGDSPSNYALTGVTVLSGGTENLAEGTSLVSVVHEDYFNQYSNVVNDDFIRLDDRADDPDTPASGKVIFFMKNDTPFFIDDTGTVTQLGFSSHEWIDVADGATMNFDLSEGVKKLKFLTGALGGNRAFTLSNATEGMVFMIRVRQDATGSRTVTWFPTASDTVTITIANPGVITTTLDLKTGTPVIFTTTDTLPTGITAGTTYYWIKTSATTGNLATSKANAIAGTTITTSSTQAGTHTMKPQILWADGSAPTLSTDKWAWDDFGFTVHDEGQITGVIIGQNI
jgi:hypothetical protein